MDCAPEVMGSCRISHFISSGCFLYICVSVRHRIMEMPRSEAELFFVLMDVVTFNGRVYFEFVLLSRKKKGEKKEEWNWFHIHYAAPMPQTTPCNHFLFSFRVSLFELTDCDSAGWWIVAKTFRWVCEPLVRHIYNYPAPSSLVFNPQGPAAKHTRRTSLYKSCPVFLHYLVEGPKVCH